MTPPKLIPFRRDAKKSVADSAGDARHQFIDLGTVSRWFDSVVISDLPQGGSDKMRTYPANGESSPETWYFVTDGLGEIVLADGTAHEVRQNDGVYFRPGAGAEFRAAAGHKVSWLTISVAGGKPTPFSSAGGQGAGTRTKNAPALPPDIFSRRFVAPRQWPANILGASAKPWWFYTVESHSRWYHSACISCIGPGGASTFHTHMDRFEGPYDTWYIVLQGTAFIRNEYEDYLFEGGGQGVYVPADASHQIINNGDDFLWYLTLSSRGGAPLALDTYSMPSGPERPGYLDEYNRIIAARKARGLPTP